MKNWPEKSEPSCQFSTIQTFRMIFQDTVIDISRPVWASAKVLDMMSQKQAANLLGSRGIFACLPDFSVIIGPSGLCALSRN